MIRFIMMFSSAKAQKAILCYAALNGYYFIAFEDSWLTEKSEIIKDFREV